MPSAARSTDGVPQMHSPLKFDSKNLPNANLHLPGWIRIMRPINLILVFSGCLVGSFLVHGAFLISNDLVLRASLAGIVAALIAASGNIVNDLLDISIDQVNRAHRPIPSGNLSVLTAKVLGGGITLAAFGIAWFISPLHLLFAFVLWWLLLMYNWMLKNVAVFGNVVIGFLVAASVGYGALIHSTTGSSGADLTNLLNTNVLIASGFAFLLTLAREAVKDISDIEGDRTHDVRTLPVRIGIPRSLSLIRLLVAGVLAFSPLPYLIWGFSGLYLLTLLPVMALLVRILILLSGPASEIRLAGSYLKWAMAFGLLSLGTTAIWPV